ncbi:MAG: DMT family transporter [Bacteroides sp.]
MKSIKGLLYAVISSSTFGLIPLFTIPAINEGVPINSVLCYRFLFSILVVGSILLVRKTNLRISMKEFLTLFSLGFFYAMTALLLTEAYFYIPSGMATTIHFLYPVLVTLIMIFFFKDKASLPIIFATMMAIGGVYLLSSSEGSGSFSITGLILTLITVCMYAFYIVGVNKSCVRKMDGLKMTFWVIFSCAIIFLVNVLVRDGGLAPIPTSSAMRDILFLALVPTLVSDFTLILAVQHIGSTTTAVLGCMEPLTAVTMGVFFLGESCNAIQLIGIGIILCAVTIVIIGGNLQAFKRKIKLIPELLLIRRK